MSHETLGGINTPGWSEDLDETPGVILVRPKGGSLHRLRARAWAWLQRVKQDPEASREDLARARVEHGNRLLVLPEMYRKPGGPR